MARSRPFSPASFVVAASLFFLARPARCSDAEPPERNAPSVDAAPPAAPPAPAVSVDAAKSAAPDDRGVVRCPSVDGALPALADIDARRRLAFVRQVMDDQARRARTWSTVWMIAGLSLVAGNSTRAALGDDFDERLAPVVGATAALTIPAKLLIRPLEVMSNQRTLESDLATLSPAEGRDGLCTALARAELLLAQSARDEARQAGLFSHTFAIVGNGAIALFLGLGFDHWRDALINGGGGLLISELQINTQPTGALTELARYRRGELSPPASSSPHVGIVPFIAHGAAGLAAVGTF